MGDPRVLTDGALQYMERNTIDHIHNMRRVESSILTEYYLNGIDYNDMYRNNLIPAGNRTESSTGKTIAIPSTDRLIVFKTKRKLYDQNEQAAAVSPSVESLVQRGMRQRRSFMVYVNGLKVPDSKIYVYASLLGTDLFIPVNNFDSTIELNSLVCTVRDFTNSKYTNHVVLASISNIITGIPYVNTIPVLNKNMVQVWVGGRHISVSNFNIVLHGNTFDVIIDRSVLPPTGAFTVEITVDKKITGRYATNYVNSNGDLILYLPEDASELKETSLFMHMCDIYINGRKISNQDLIQKTHRHIYYKKSDPSHTIPYETEIILTDKSQSEKAFADYMNDFMMYQRWRSSEEELGDIGNDNDSDDFSPSFVNFTTMTFPPENRYIVDSNLTRLMTNEQRALKMIEENSYYLKNLLSYYGVPEENYTADRNPLIPNKSGEGVSILLDVDSDDVVNENTRLLSLFVNDRKIPNSYVEQIRQWKTDVVKIPISEFSASGSDKIRLYKHYPRSNYSQKWVKFSTSGESWVGTPAFKTVNDIASIRGDLGDFNASELRVFVQADPETEDAKYYFIKVDGSEVFYRIVENVPANYQLKTIPNSGGGPDLLQIQIPTGSDIGLNNPVFIVNPNFYSTLTYRLGENNDPNTMGRIILNSLNSGDLIPLIMGDYLTQVYVDGRIMVPDLDYFFITPERLDITTATVLIFRRKINASAVVEIVFTGSRNVNLTKYQFIPPTNKYGFIFFETLTVPFSLDYMDLYVNGKKMTSSDIEVYTDRLIRVKREPLPFIDVVLYTRLSIGFDLFEPYIQQYLATRNNFDDYIREFCRDVIFESTLSGPEIPESNKDIEDVYRDRAPSDIDDTSKTENPIIPPGTSLIPIRFNPLINRLAFDFNRDINKMPKYFDANQYTPLWWDEYLILVEDKYKINHEIPVDANDLETLSEDWVFDPNRHYRNSSEVIALLTDLIGKGYIDDVIDSRLDLSNYRNPLLSKFMYPRDVVVLDSNKALDIETLEEDIYLDSNTIVDKPTTP